ncbi:MAG: universal stress protein [Propionibacteriaceae bacterium]|jgi:nucleotide-binding universal stress UspA family protein|nr:universal stress protein [Propionibacteriaceae bacterium]
MTDHGRILVGIDGSEDGIRAARFAIGRASMTGGDLWFVHGVDDSVATGGWGVMYDPSILKEAGQAAVQQACDLALSLGIDSARIHSDVVIGNPVGVLSEFSKRAEILILGRRASSGLERMFVGSTSTSLVASSSCPMVVISAASTPELTGDCGVITVAMGGSGDTALRWGCQEAQLRGAKVEVIHIIPDQPATVMSFIPASPAQTSQWEARVLAGIEQVVEPVQLDYPDLEITIKSQRGVLVEELIQESSRVDLLVLGVRPRPAIVVGGPVRAVLAHSNCPVALVNR